jgi:CRISPR-associated endonuclease/helicase Cas3
MIPESEFLFHCYSDPFYFALPTMATANAMYARLTETYRAMFDDADTHQPSLALAHGKALRNEGFLRSLAREPACNGRGEPDTGAFCSGWIADSRRKALLAQAGAGTIDQALMAVLPLRYQSIRLHGLIGKVLILDEIHSFDAFMLKLIETLLELHSRLGGSAIVMSATLPTAIRARLLRTFAKGRGLVSPAACSGAYPLVTTLSGDLVTQTPLPLATGSGRRVAVERIGSVGEAEALALELARRGAAVALIRSTVDAATASFERLKADHADCELFHARFLLDDRLAIETRVLDRFGKAGEQAGREGRILVATQVVEQSLDIDFDSVITDLAPMDLLIQRAGRLWRHRRPDRPVAGPVLHVVSPAPTDACEADWLKADLQEAEWVYEDPARLWLTARRLFDAGVIVADTLADRETIPGHVRGLIEAAYTDDSAALPTPSLAAALDRHEGKTMGMGAIAGQSVLKPGAGYVRDVAWETEARAVTRLELRPRVTARLARRDGNTLRPLIGEDWSLAELRISLKLAQGLAAPKGDEDRLLCPAWAEADEGAALLVLEPDGEGWKSAGGRFAYDATHGLRRFGNEKTG